MATAVKESRTLIIEGDLVRVQRVVTEREVKTSDFIGEIARTQPLDTGPLPWGCIWVLRRLTAGERIVGVYVIQRPAGSTLIRFKEKPADKDDPRVVKDLVLSWPNTLWFVRCVGDAIQDLHLTVTKAAVGTVGRDTPLFKLPMPNQYDCGDGAVCTGTIVVAKDVPLVRRVEDLVQQTLDSLWNNDMMPSFEGMGIAGLDDWAAKTCAEPNFHMNLVLSRHRRRTVGEMLDYLMDAVKE